MLTVVPSSVLQMTPTLAAPEVTVCEHAPSALTDVPRTDQPTMYRFCSAPPLLGFVYPMSMDTVWSATRAISLPVASKNTGVNGAPSTDSLREGPRFLVIVPPGLMVCRSNPWGASRSGRLPSQSNPSTSSTRTVTGCDRLLTRVTVRSEPD